MSPSSWMKSRLAPLSSTSTAKGPYAVGSARPSTPATSRAAAHWSFAWTRVWFSSTLISVLLSRLQLAGIGGHVDRVLAQRFQSHDLQHLLVRRGQDHRCSGRRVVGASPVHRGHAPAVTRRKSREAVLGHRRRQVIADAALVLQELLRHHGADRVAPDVLGSRSAAAVAVEPR